MGAIVNWAPVAWTLAVTFAAVLAPFTIWAWRIARKSP